LVLIMFGRCIFGGGSCVGQHSARTGRGRRGATMVSGIVVDRYFPILRRRPVCRLEGGRKNFAHDMDKNPPCHKNGSQSDAGKRQKRLRPREADTAWVRGKTGGMGRR
jgi:hypothetical protein